MEAAKRFYDNSYNERLETAASAKAYLEVQNKETEKLNVEARELRQVQSSLICNVISVTGSIFYCVLILGLILIPLIKETQIHKMKVGFSVYKQEMIRLEKEIESVQIEFSKKINLTNIEERARLELGLRKPDENNTTHLNSENFFSLDDTLHDISPDIDVKDITDETVNTASD